MSELPKFHEYFGPILDVMADGAERSSREIVVRVADAMKIPADLRDETVPSGERRLNNRVFWGITYLKQAGCLDRPKRAIYVIAQRGRDLRAAHPDGIGLADLQQFPEYREFKQRSGTKGNAIAIETPPATGLTPIEQIAAAVDELESAVSQDLIDRIRTMPPEFLEKAVLRLLVAMGYGGNEGDAQHLGGPGDGGFDGVINQDKLGLERIYVQAKRYGAGNTVGRPDVQGFVGALHGNGAAGGVFITTSRFTPEAVNFARGINPRVILIDGERLGTLMIQYGIGVQETRSITLVEVDEDFFE
jgi:restriction system protein